MILHIEDADNWRKLLHRQFAKPIYSSQLGSGELKYVGSQVGDYVADYAALNEVARLQQEAGNGLSWVSIVTAQIARTFLTYNLPAAIISDTSFPLNGKKVVEWLQSHGYRDYPLIGLSGTSVDSLEPELHEFFITGNARYFDKESFDMDSIAQQVVYNVGYTRKLYG